MRRRGQGSQPDLRVSGNMPCQRSQPSTSELGKMSGQRQQPDTNDPQANRNDFQNSSWPSAVNRATRKRRLEPPARRRREVEPQRSNWIAFATISCMAGCNCVRSKSWQGRVAPIARQPRPLAIRHESERKHLGSSRSNRVEVRSYACWRTGGPMPGEAVEILKRTNAEDCATSDFVPAHPRCPCRPLWHNKQHGAIAKGTHRIHRHQVR